MLGKSKALLGIIAAGTIFGSFMPHPMQCEANAASVEQNNMEDTILGETVVVETREPKDIVNKQARQG